MNDLSPGSAAPIYDIARALPYYDFQVIVDVGANIGQSALAYTKAAPSARIYAIEAADGAFRELSANIRKHSNITAIQSLVSSAENPRRFLSHEDSTMNRVVTGDCECEDVVTLLPSPLKSIFKTLQVDHVSYLKIDTEGHDLEVLAGIDFSSVDIDFVEVECSMNAYNRYHVPFERVSCVLNAAGYYLFKLYEQTLEWQDGGRPLLRRANVVFVNKRLVGSLDTLPNVRSS